MAFFENLQRQVGEPRRPEMPGAPPTPSKSNSFSNPPAAASGPQGRPPRPAPSFPGGSGPALPTSSAARPAASSPTGAPGAPARPQMPGGTQPSAGPAASAQAPQAPAAAGAPQAAMLFSFDHMPTREELMTLPPGVQAVTPYGSVGQDGKLTLSPEGQQKYQAAVVERKKKFGAHPFAGDPNAPQPQVDLGKPAYNVFSNTWVL